MTLRSSPYKSAALRQITGLTLRPGGTDLTDRALSCCGFGVGARLLDVGCGTGASVEHLQGTYGLAVAGIDPSLTLIAEGLARNPALPLAEGSAEALPVADGELDGILCECVLSLVDDLRQVLQEFRRALRVGGFLILSDLFLKETGKNSCEASSGQQHEMIIVRSCASTPLSAQLFPERSRREQAVSDQGVRPRTSLETLLGFSDFTICLWEDHTQLLQELAARLVLAHGSLDGLWCASRNGNCFGERPGYYLLVARKER
jgi:arsenite methyltransferase